MLFTPAAHEEPVSLEAPPDFPDDDAERSLWIGETGIRLVLRRLAPSQTNLERLSELIAANERDERCELMWGSPGTILAGRELGLEVTAGVEWLDGLLERTGDERWLARARAFAMHAARQVELSRSEYGRGRCTLWTGDLGIALYLADCIDGGGKLPLP